MTKQEIENTVSLFYPSTVKVYYINSSNGKEYVPPYRRIFVSLGITSSIETISQIKDCLDSISYLNASLATIRTVRNSEGRYLNEVIRMGDDYTQEDQYVATGLKDSTESDVILDREAALDLSDKLTDDTNYELSYQLKALISKFDEKGCWSDLGISYNKEEKTVVPFHKYINYRQDKETGAEYRIGIVVEEKK